MTILKSNPAHRRSSPRNDTECRNDSRDIRGWGNIGRPRSGLPGCTLPLLVATRSTNLGKNRDHPPANKIAATAAPPLTALTTAG